MDARRFKDAEQLISRFIALESDNAGALSRQVRVHCQFRRRTEALSVAGQLWFDSNNANFDGCMEALDALDVAGFGAANLTQVNQLLGQGRLPRVQATRALAVKAGRAGYSRELAAFAQAMELRALEYGSWEPFALVLDALIDVGNPRWVIGFRDHHAELCFNDTQLWMILGRALHNDGRADEAARWLLQWRQRSGIEMWGVANLIWAQLALGHYAACAENARALLAEVEHDHSASGVVEAMVLAGIFNDDAQGAQENLGEYREVLLRAEKKNRSVQAIELYEEMQGEQGGFALLNLDKRFRGLFRFEDLSHPDVFKKAWNRALRPRLPWALRVWHWISRLA
jgi:hypothetical protein